VIVGGGIAGAYIAKICSADPFLEVLLIDTKVIFSSSVVFL